MPGAGMPSWILVAGIGLAGLLLAGLAAGIHLATRRNPSDGDWSGSLRQIAADSPWRGVDVLWILLALALAHLVRPLLPDAGTWDLILFQGGLIAVLSWRAGSKPRPFGRRRPGQQVWAEAVIRWLAILPVLWFIAFVWHILLKGFGWTPDIQPAIRLFLESTGLFSRILFLILAVGVAPIVEEALFRGILLPLFARRIGPGPAIAITSVGFALLHGEPGTLAALTVFSVALSLAYVRTRSLRTPILMHMIFNGVNLLLLAILVRAGLI